MMRRFPDRQEKLRELEIIEIPFIVGANLVFALAEAPPGSKKGRSQGCATTVQPVGL
jgi:hypothetical protein